VIRWALAVAIGMASLGAVAIVVQVDGAHPAKVDPARSKVRDASPRVRAPNVVVVMTDDQDVPSLRTMPRVQRLLAERGTTFTRAFATFPLCCPSRATFLTGQYAHNHGVRDNLPPRGGFPAFHDESTLPVWLQAAGYRTAFVGKYLNGYAARPTYVPPGWSDWRALVTPFQMYGHTLNQNGELRTYGYAARDYQTDVLTRKTAGFIRASAPRPKPFFITVAPLAPHDEGVLDDVPEAPRNPRPALRDWGRFANASLPRTPAFNEADIADKPRPVRDEPPLEGAYLEALTRLHRSRLESLRAVDRMVGQLVATLRDVGELRRTVVTFTSDNGFLLGEHRQVGKEQVYEESVRVPLVVRGPGFAPGSSDRRLVGNIDLAPTIADLAGAQPGIPVDGHSVLEDRSGWRDALLLQNLSKAKAFAAVRTRRFVLSRGRMGTELYDLSADPFQLENLAGDPEHRGVMDRLASRLARLRTCAGQACGPQRPSNGGLAD
jgi:N-acetylglucosamine-6-sulfatase